MLLRFVVEKVEKGAVTHIGVENLREAEEVLSSIPKKNRGGTYRLYTKEMILIKEDE